MAFDLAQYMKDRAALVERTLERQVPSRNGRAARLSEAMRYSLLAGGKRLRPILAIAACEAVGGAAENCLNFACALEMIHTYSLIHDDLPCMDDDDLRRGRPTNHKVYGEAVAVLAGDALMVEAMRLALSYPTPHVARELARATLGMIGGQYLDITGTAPDEVTLHKLKTGCLFAASVGMALWAAEVPEREQGPWRAFGDELGLLFQIVDDILDGDGYVLSHGPDGARRLADEAAVRAQAALASVAADTSVLADVVDGLKSRTA